MSVFQLLSQTARARTTEVAVVQGDLEHSFGDLLSAIHAIASLGRETGVGEGDLLGLLLPRDLRLPAAMFASLGLGATFVPLSEKYPRERLDWLLERHRIRHVVTSPELAPRLPDAAVPIVLPSTTFDMEADPPGQPSGQAPPYIIFTSGSTGDPKGVIIRESSLLNLITWAAERYSPEERRAVLASTPTTFDLSIFELIATLCNGGRIVLVDSILDLLSGPTNVDVSLINTVPSAARELVRFRRFPEATRVVNLAGEALHQDLVDDIYDVASGVEKVFNLYGPSEDTTYSTEYLAPRGASENAVPIGKALPGKHAHLLDEQLFPVADDEAGEVCLSGAGLAAGYLNDPELTAKKFVQPTRGPLQGKRIYRTGDLASRGPAGQLTYLGRIDRQIKVRGVRIEPGEIESELRRIPGVHESAVTKITDETGNDHLLTFVARTDEAPGAGLTADGVLETLRTKLPAFMIPSRVEFLQTIPLTSNGKVDYRRLEALGKKLLAP